MADEVLTCLPLEERQYWFKSRCGSDRDCIPDDRQNIFRVGYCGAVAWCRKNPGSGRYVEVWDAQNTRRQFKMTERNSSYRKYAACAEWAAGRDPYSYTFGEGPNPYTVAFPGISDILKVPGIDSPELRRERAERYARARSPGLELLSWVPKVLNKLDDAQDLLYTGLVIAGFILRKAGARFLPGLGILVTINDILNAFT